MPEPSPELEYCACPTCASSERTEPSYNFSPYGVVRCRTCGLLYLYPRRTQAAMVADYQDERYYDQRHDGGYSDYRSQEDGLRRTFRALLGRMQAHGMTGGTLLEIGCAYGFFLDEARAFFTVRSGLDMSASALESAATMADRVYEGGLEAVDGGPFDMVIAIQVIEHVYDPVEFVQQAVAKLAPGGWLLLATPHAGSVWRPLFRQRWPSFKIPEHVTYFDRRTLTDLLQRGGLETVKSLPYPHAFPLALVWSKFGWTAPRPLAETNLWIPWTTLALAGRKPIH